MLGLSEAAAETLDTIYPLVDLASGGNPSVIRALPLSWDALLIASALAFILGRGDTYQRLRSAVELVKTVPNDARWTFCLPEPGSDPRAYVAHECQSSSNICAIMCEIASRTAFGGRPFYAEEQQPPPPPPQAQPQRQQLLQEPAPNMPAVVLSSPHHQLRLGPATQQSREHRYGYDYEGKAMRRMPSDLRGSFPATAGGGDTAMTFFDGGFDGGFGGGGGPGAVEIDAAAAAAAAATAAAAAAAAVPSDAGAFVDAAAYKRRRMMAGVDGGGPSESSSNDFMLPNGGNHPLLQTKLHPVYGNASVTGRYDNSVGKAFNFCLPGSTSGGQVAGGRGGIGSGGGGGGGVGDSNPAGIGGDVRGEEGDLDCGGLGLTRGFHNMSLSRLSGQLGGMQQDPEQLGRVPSEGIMDLSSSLGSFNMDMMGIDGVGGGVKSEERLGSFTGIPQASSECDGGGANNLGGIMFPASDGGSSGSGNGTGNKRPLGGGGGGGAGLSASKPPPRLSSFSTYATSLCRSSSSSMLQPLARDDGSIGQCGSDLGHDIVGSAEDFMDEDGNDDICGNIFSVDAILRDTGVKGDDAKGDFDADDSGDGGGDEAVPPPPAGGGGIPSLASDPVGGGGGGGGGGGSGSSSDASLSLDEQQQVIATKALADFYEAGDVLPTLPTQPSPKMEASC